MRKTMFGILVSMLMIGSVLASATVVENKVDLKDVKTNFFEIEDGEISVTMPIGSYEIKQTDQGDYVSVEDFGRLLIPGKPELPTKIYAIAIPPGAEFDDVTYEIGEGIELPGEHNVIPTPLPKVIGVEDPEVREKEEQIYKENYESTYNSDNQYPASVVEFERTAGFRKYNLVDVRVTPFSYKPLSGKLTFYPDITVHVSYTFPEGVGPAEIMFDEIDSFEQRASEFILNHETVKDWYPPGKSGRETYDYVIITLDSLTSSVDPLVDWEEVKGRSVKVVTTSWINSNYDGYDLAEKIRNFLRDKYPSSEWGIEYVCLIGDYDDVMIRRVAQSTGYGQPETDFYHAELTLPDSQSWDADGDHQYGENSDPIDFYAEVYVGRIPWSTPSIVESICEKTAAYEEEIDPSFKKNILLLGAYFWPDTDNAVLMEYKTDDSTHPWMSDWTMTKMYEQGQSSYPMDYNLDYNNVKSVWSSGTFAFVNWAGHGSPTACYEYYPSQAFVDTNTCNYLNDDYPAIVFADACSNSDTDEDNIGQMMLKQGAVGFLGATKVAYGMPAWNQPYSGSSQSMDYFFTTGCTEGILTQGESHQLALQEMYENDLWYYQKYEHFQWGALWGNPDLTMGEVITTEPPSIPIIDGPTAGVPHAELTFTVESIDPDGDMIYYKWDLGNGEVTFWYGPYNSGETIEFTYAYMDVGTYEVKAYAKDINHRTSEDWSDPITVTIGDNSAPEKPTITGPTSGKVGVSLDFTFASTDPEGHDVYYMVLWGDGSYMDYTGPYASGEEATFSHTWTSTGEFNIISKAQDQYEAKSPQNNLKLRIQLSIAITNPVLFRILENLMSHFPLLNHLLLNI